MLFVIVKLASNLYTNIFVTIIILTDKQWFLESQNKNLEILNFLKGPVIHVIGYRVSVGVLKYGGNLDWKVWNLDRPTYLCRVRSWSWEGELAGMTVQFDKTKCYLCLIWFWINFYISKMQVATFRHIPVTLKFTMM